MRPRSDSRRCVFQSRSRSWSAMPCRRTSSSDQRCSYDIVQGVGTTGSICTCCCACDSCSTGRLLVLLFPLPVSQATGALSVDMVRRERLEDDDAVGWDSVSASIPDPVNVEVPQSAEHYDDVRLLQKEARRLPRRTACVAVLLLVVGLVCFISGLASIVSGGERVYTLLILGSVLMIPGGYQSYVLYHSWRGTPGFSFDQVPSYDD